MDDLTKLLDEYLLLLNKIIEVEKKIANKLRNT